MPGDPVSRLDSSPAPDGPPRGAAVNALAEAVARLRKAIESEAYPEARTTLLDLRERLDEALRGLPAADPQAGQLLREAGALLAWARRTVLAGRAHAAIRLARLRPLPAAYRAAPAGPRHSWKFEG